MTRREAARELGVTPDSISRWLTGKKQPAPRYREQWDSIRPQLEPARSGPKLGSHNDNRVRFEELMTAAEYDALVAAGSVEPYKGYRGPMNPAMLPDTLDLLASRRGWV